MENEQLENLKGKNWVATMALCWFLGLYGGHRFYTGKSNTAWVMVVLTLMGITAPISFVWSIVDGFMIALGKFQHEDGSELYEKIDWLGYVYIGLMILTIVGIFAYMGIILAAVAAIVTGAGSAMPPVAP